MRRRASVGRRRRPPDARVPGRRRPRVRCAVRALGGSGPPLPGAHGERGGRGGGSGAGDLPARVAGARALRARGALLDLAVHDRGECGAERAAPPVPPRVAREPGRRRRSGSAPRTDRRGSPERRARRCAARGPGARGRARGAPRAATLGALAAGRRGPLLRRGRGGARDVREVGEGADPSRARHAREGDGVWRVRMTELYEKLCAFLDGELGEGEAAALRAELARRPELAARLAELAAVDAGLRALPAGAVAPDLRAKLERRIRAERSPGAARRPPRSRAGPGRRRRWLAAAVLSAAAAALALVVLPRLQHRETALANVEPAPIVEPAPAPADAAVSEDLPVIEVLDVLAELDELEGVGSG